jgi:hypothetical protein
MDIAQAVALAAVIFTAIVEIIRAIIRLVETIEAWRQRRTVGASVGVT